MNIYLQYAHHAHDEFDEIASAGTREVLEQFDSFDWVGEIERAEKLQKVAPTLSVESKDKTLLIWVSGVKTGANIQFISECNYPGEVSSLFGLIKKQGIVSSDTQNFSKDQAKQALTLFMNKDFESLKGLYSGA